MGDDEFCSHPAGVTIMPVRSRLVFLTLLLTLLASSVHAQTVIDLFPGDVIDNNTVIASGTTVNVLGGDIELGVDLANGTLNVELGNVAVGATGIGTGFTNSNNEVNVSGGTLGGFFQLTNNTELNFSGGQIESFGVFSNSTASISGGSVNRFPDIFDTGTVNITGGDINAIRVFAGGEVNLFGTEFFIDGQALDLTVGEEFVITQRNVNLSGFLADGSFIETDLNTSFGAFGGANPDGAAAGARVTVTAVPEPGTVILFAFGACMATIRRKRFGS